MAEFAEITGPQTLASFADLVLHYSARADRLTFATIRKMRKDPIVSLARTIFFSGLFQGKWSYELTVEEEDAPEGVVDFIKEQLQPIRLRILQHAGLGCFDFGFQPFEKVFDVNGLGQNVLKKLKPLLPDLTSIQTDIDTGAFTGLRNNGTTLPLEAALLFNFDVEGTNWYGESQTGKALELWNETKKVRASSARYDAKIAGSHWVVRYPANEKSEYMGQKTPNDEIARKILASLQASGSVAIPVSPMGGFSDPKQRIGWDIQLITATGAAADFTTRFQELDKNKARVLGFPERSLLEGQYGTKAEAGEHKDFVLTMIEYRHECLLEILNWHAVNHLLRLNYGPDTENLVRVQASPLSDSSKQLLSAIYDKILSSSDGMLREVDAIDVQEIAETLGIPRSDEEPDPLEGLDDDDDDDDFSQDVSENATPIASGVS